jgi:circadian clock protein KaiB
MASRRVALSLCLFVAGDSPDSAIALANLGALFPSREGAQVEIEVVDVQRDPASAARHGIMVTPTLLKLSPAPPCRILGNLKNREALLHLLAVGTTPADQDGEGGSRASDRVHPL